MALLMCYDSMSLILLLQEGETHFNDLGKLLLAGVAVALVFAIIFTLVRLRLREKKPQTSSFISIGSVSKKD
jgi:ABC-type Fe3+-siderophore transport system permease subunit